MNRIDRSRLIVKKKGFRFEPFRPTAKNEKMLIQADLPSNTELIAFERGGERRVLLLKEMIYHHVAQGELAGEPYLVTF